MVFFPLLKRHTIRNHVEVILSDICGCYKCLNIFTVDGISTEDWWGESNGQLTAVCPRCGIDSVIGSASGYPINRELLKAMHAAQFALDYDFARDGAGYDVYDSKTRTWFKEKL